MVTKAPPKKAPAASRLGAWMADVLGQRCAAPVHFQQLPGADKAVPKRKPAVKAAAAPLDPDSPAVVPSGKVRRIRPSPFHKGSGLAGGSKAEDMSEDDDDVVEVVPAARGGARRGAAAAKKPVYVEEDDDDESELDEESEDGSDFVPDD